MEVFSEESSCQRVLSNIPPITWSGHSLSMLDNKIVAASFDVQQKQWSYLSMEDPRGGLLANRWFSTAVLGTDAPVGHTAHVFGSELILLGGDHATQGSHRDASLKLENGRKENDEWNKFKLLLPDGSPLTAFFSNACGVKISKDRFLVLGGTEKDSIQNRVLDINMKEEKVQERPSLQFARARHSCAMASNTSVLVSGGVSNTQNPGANLAVDEMYNIHTGVSNVLSDTMTTQRYDHSIIRLGESIYALGGRAANGSDITTVERFETSTNTWTPHPKDLLSALTGGLAVTAFPKSAVDCINGCQCGVKASKDTRIVNGAEVPNGSYHWVGLLLKKDEDGEAYPEDSKCSATLVRTMALLY